MSGDLKSLPLMEALAQLYPDSSKRTLDQWIKWGRVSIDGICLRDKRAEIRADQRVEILPKPKQILFPNLRILYQDRWLVAIDKPSKMLSVATDDPNEPHAHQHLIDHFGPLFAVHRLDRDASGLLLFARGKLSGKRLESLFESRTIKRKYFAVVEGRVASPSGTWESHLLELDNKSVIVVPPGQGKLAITHYRSLYRSKNFSYLYVEIETGRKHQIRVHTQEAGHPIVGDKRYRSLCNPIERLALHAFRLEFIHPFTKRTISLFAPLPRAFHKIVPSSLSEQLENL